MTGQAGCEREKMLLAMLFASGESVAVEKLAEALGADIPLTRNLLLRIAEEFDRNKSAILLREIEDSFVLCTNPAYHSAVERLIKAKPKKTALSGAQMETLAIIAFRQPITKPAIERLRGVNSDHAVSRLVEAGLVMETGRLDGPGRPIMFGTTEDFLLFYGFSSVEELKKRAGQSEEGQLTVDGAAGQGRAE